MKKILMFWCCVFALNVNVAFASGRCNPMVNYSGGTPIQSSMFDDYLNIQGRSGTLVCVGSKSFKDSDRDNVCDANQVVFANYAWIGRKQGTNDADSKYRKYVCSKDSQDGGEWFVYDIDKCKDYASWNNADNTEEVLVIGSDNASRARHRTDDKNYFLASGDGCLSFDCISGYRKQKDVNGMYECIAESDKCEMAGTKYAEGDVVNTSACIATYLNTGLKSSSYVRDTSSSCSAICNKNGWDIKIRDGECTGGRVVAADGKSCVESQAQRQQRQQRQQSQQREACEQSGGDFSGGTCTCRAEKNLVPSNGKCECVSSDYKFESAATGCVEKDESVRRRNCEAASATGAYWDGSKCLCNGADMVFVGGKCEELAEAKLCKAASGATWANGVCTCKKAGYEWNGSKCVEGEDLIRAREENARKQRIAGVKTKITNAAKKLDDIMSGLKVSVWKTSDGSFNTSRLASDSIAGVVLGTAGGLITSHVVKKAQVKNGFEDIQCTVGGQKVADWGDEFTVGIQ